MSQHRERTGRRRFISASELGVVVLALLAGSAIIVGTVVDTSVTPVAAPSSSSVRPTAVPAPASGSDAVEEEVPGEIGEATEATESARPVTQRKPVVNPLVEQVESMSRKTKVATTSFRVATLNILGSNHARNGLSRAAREAELLKARGAQLIGLQEVQRDQRQVFLNNLPAMEMFPQDALGRDGYRVQIMWRSDRFEMVDSGGSSHTFNGIRSVPIPYVLLRDRLTQARFWVIVTHNSPNGRQSERNASVEIQIDLIKRLRASGHPVMLMGDLNEKSTVFCKLVTRAAMASANGGSGAGGCQMPGGAQRIDWIFGTADSVDFSGYVQDGTTKSAGMSDHYLIYSDATVIDRS